jgi:ferrous iron transport protein A
VTSHQAASNQALQPGTWLVFPWRLQLTNLYPPQLSLADASVGEVFTVEKVVAPAGSDDWSAQLEDIGFLAGERVVIMARGMPGGDPLVVRVGLSTFALRLVEAACVKVKPLVAEVPV